MSEQQGSPASSTSSMEQQANDMLQALSIQRNKHADDAAGLFADLQAAKRRIAELEAKLKACEDDVV